MGRQRQLQRDFLVTTKEVALPIPNSICILRDSSLHQKEAINCGYFCTLTLGIKKKNSYIKTLEKPLSGMVLFTAWGKKQFYKWRPSITDHPLHEHCQMRLYPICVFLTFSATGYLRGFFFLLLFNTIICRKC